MKKRAVCFFPVMPGLTRHPVEYCVAKGDSLFDWIPAFAGMTKEERQNDESSGQKFIF